MSESALRASDGAAATSRPWAADDERRWQAFLRCVEMDRMGEPSRSGQTSNMARLAR